MEIDSLQKLCVHLDEFALARAIIDFNHDRFVAWNLRFLSRTGYSQEEIRVIRTDKIIVESDSRFTNPDEDGAPSAEFTPVAVRTGKAAAAAPGHLVRSQHNLGYLMLDEISGNSIQFEQGRLVGKEQERMRIVRLFREEISSGMLGAVFDLHAAKAKLKAVGSPEADQVSEASTLLSEAIQKMNTVIADEKKIENGSAELD
jgi:hypothetical protein